MQGAFITYLKLGLGHITDVQGFDHMLFLLALCAVYTFSQRNKVFWLVTAFTIGHSLTLALSALEVLSINRDLVEILIPVTIMLTAVLNMIEKGQSKKEETTSKVWLLKYALVLFFGFIHGMGFSTYFKMLMGETSNIVNFLFAFNIGVEIGQLLIVLIILLIAWFVLNILNLKQKVWNVVISSFSFLMSAYLIYSLLNG